MESAIIKGETVFSAGSMHESTAVDHRRGGVWAHVLEMGWDDENRTLLRSNSCRIGQSSDRFYGIIC